MKNKFNRRQFLKLAGAGTAAAVLAACGATPTTAPSGGEAAQPAAPAERKKVTFTMFGHPGMIEQMVPIFNQSQSEVELVFERSEGQGYDEKLAAAIAGGSAWDCFRTNGANMMRLGAKNTILDVMPYQKADKTYPEDGYLDGMLDTVELNGKRYGHPTWVQAFWLFYNKKLFDEAGVAYPDVNTTFEDYVGMCQKLTKTDSNGMITQYGAAGWGGWPMPIANDAWTNGGHYYYNDDRTAIDVDDPETVKVLQDEADMMNVQKVHPSPLSPPTTPATLVSGKVATQFDGDWYPWDQKDAWSEDYDATLTPLRNGNRVHVYWVEPLVINAVSKYPEGAYKWMAWFGGNIEATKIQCKCVLPTYKKAYEDPAIVSQWLTSPRPAGHAKLIAEHPKFKKWWKAEPHGPEFENTVWYPEIDNLWMNKATAEEVCKTIMEKGNELMKQPIS